MDAISASLVQQIAAKAEQGVQARFNFRHDLEFGTPPHPRPHFRENMAEIARMSVEKALVHG